ncbi:MAG: hypothetical protein DWC09_04360 [Candidatus Poseidoniales archaeon]|nr:MAG: hypothetical protein DWC09_04360 [Candidatus Poseidoniales archaeon]
MLGSQNRRRRKGKVDRRQAALNSQSKLVELVVGRKENDGLLVQSSIRHLVRISRRHRLPVPESVRHLYCKKCLTPFVHGKNVRTRILAGQRIVTCLSCANIRRYGGGPKFHRKKQNR